MIELKFLKICFAVLRQGQGWQCLETNIYRAYFK